MWVKSVANLRKRCISDLAAAQANNIITKANRRASEMFCEPISRLVRIAARSLPVCVH
jgi:hypothetical protein